MYPRVVNSPSGSFSPFRRLQFMAKLQNSCRPFSLLSMEVIGQYVATPPFIQPLQIEHTSMKSLYPIIELEFCLELWRSNFASEIHFASELHFGDSFRFGASLRRFASLRSFTSEIRFAAELHFGDSLRFRASLRRFTSLRSFTSELSAEKLPFSASIRTGAL